MQTHSILLGQTSNWLYKHYLQFPGTEHVALHARSGTGKTRSFVIPNCFNWPGSLIVLDIKREVFEATAGHRMVRMGQRVYLFDPTAEDNCSHCWNPFAFIDRASKHVYDQISRQAYMLFPEDSKENTSSSQFWIPNARMAFTAVATMVAETENEPFTMAHVLSLFMRPDYQTRLINRITAARVAGRPYSNAVVMGVFNCLRGASDMVESFRAQVTAKLGTFNNLRVAAATSHSDFDVRLIRHEPMTVYISVAPGNIPRMRPLLRLLFDQVINLNTNVTPEQDPSLQVQVLLMLDEFARLGHMPELAETAQFVRGFGLRMAFVIQDKAQVAALYGENHTRDLFANIGVELVFGSGDIRLAQELEKRLGDDTMIFSTRNRPRYMAWFRPDRQNLSFHPHRRPLMLAQEIVGMPAWQQLVLRPGVLPAKSGRIVWYEDRRFADLVLPVPHIPMLKIEHTMDDGTINMPAHHH